MELYNLKQPAERVTFLQAVRLGLGQQQGLFFPRAIARLDGVDALLQLDFVARSQRIMQAWLGDELDQHSIASMVEQAFNFPLPLVKVAPSLFCLELFHGPTLAFKDFGARFMAQCLAKAAQNEPITILTATSGDTGAAVADAFYGLDNINVVVLYPRNKVSDLQEKMFATLGGNIHCIAVNGDFDGCQQLVKDAFSDQELRQKLGLNSANSINISRLLAQACYYFEAVAQYQSQQDDQPVVAVPCGNFGNLTAGLLAKAMGLPVKRFIAATNANDTVPRFLRTGHWQVNPTVATMSNAMDVAAPNNWPRVAELSQTMHWSASMLTAVAIDEPDTQASLTALYQAGYLSEPHAAVAAAALKQSLAAGEGGIFLGTAHPAKFKQVVEAALGRQITLPAQLAKVANKTILSQTLDCDFSQLRTHLISRFAT